MWLNITFPLSLFTLSEKLGKAEGSGRHDVSYANECFVVMHRSAFSNN